MVRWKGNSSRPRIALRLCALLATLSAAPTARADQEAVATELFQRGKALMAEERTEEACRAFGESYRLYASSGTLLNLAVCHEKLGKIASAWSEFNRVIPMARSGGREDRAELAEQRAAILGPKLSRLVLVVPGAGRAAGLAIRVDGVEIDDLLWGGAGLPEDAGTHVVEARSKGKKSWSARVDVGGEADKKSIEVPMLEDAPEALPSVSVARSEVSTLAEADALAKWNAADTVSPLEKYMGLADASNASAAKAWEHANHGKGVSGVQDWFGHCPGWTAAAMLNAPLKHAALVKSDGHGGLASCSEGTAGCVKFEIGDVNALMAEVHVDSNSRFIGGRCDTKPADIKRDDAGRIVRNGGGCQGLNPGARCWSSWASR